MDNTYIKYPRTFHLPCSPNATDDDKKLKSDEHFNNFKEVVVTVKMDGENCTVYNDGYIHARSIDGSSYPWQSKVKYIIQNWCYLIPDGYRVCGENMQAKHSISYTFKNVNELFQCFSIYDDKNNCLSWDETVSFCEKNNIKIVDEIYRGVYNIKNIIKTFSDYCDLHKSQEVEGFVVRNADSFNYNDFDKNVGKYVRYQHLKTDANWSKTWENNKIINKN